MMEEDNAKEYFVIDANFLLTRVNRSLQVGEFAYCDLPFLLFLKANKLLLFK